jgi:hypothetical protein
MSSHVRLEKNTPGNPATVCNSSNVFAAQTKTRAKSDVHNYAPRFAIQIATESKVFRDPANTLVDRAAVSVATATTITVMTTNTKVLAPCRVLRGP